LFEALSIHVSKAFARAGFVLNSEVDQRCGSTEAAARVPVSKSSALVVPPKGMSRCVCTSMPPGKHIYLKRPITSWRSVEEVLADRCDLAIRDGNICH